MVSTILYSLFDLALGTPIQYHDWRIYMRLFNHILIPLLSCIGGCCGFLLTLLVCCSCSIEGWQHFVWVFFDWICKSVLSFKFAIWLSLVWSICAVYFTFLKGCLCCYANPTIFCAHVLIYQAQIEQWIDFASMEIDANIAKWYYPRAGFAPFLPPVSCKFHQTCQFQ